MIITTAAEMLLEYVNAYEYTIIDLHNAGITLNDFCAVLDGNKSIDEELDRKLCSLFYTDDGFWLSLDAPRPEVMQAYHTSKKPYSYLYKKLGD